MTMGIRTPMRARTRMPTVTLMPTRMTMATSMSGTDPASLTRLLLWLSPAFPVGAYAYSHGLEWAVEAGDLEGEAGLQAWLESLLREGFVRSDAILVAAAHRSADAPSALAEVNDLALALAPSAELRLETAQQGRSFFDLILAAWPRPGLDAAAELTEIAYPVALGVAAASHGVALRAAVQAYGTAALGNLVSAAIRLAPIGQTAGQRILGRLAPRVDAFTAEVLRCDLDDVGAATFRADLGSLRHETQYTRLFRS
jgi:urease accessory protein